MPQSTLDFVEWDVADTVALPILVIEVPPLLWVHGEALRLHRLAKELAVPSLEGRAARIFRVGSLSALVIRAHHFNGLARLQIVQGEIHRRSAIVLRTLGGIRDEPFLGQRSRV